MRTLKQKAQRFGHDPLACKDILVTYEKLLRKTGTVYYSSVIEEN